MERMNLTIDVRANNIGPRRVNLRSNLVVANLIATIQDKFNLDGNFELRLEHTRQPLPLGLELDDAGVEDGAVLVCAPVVEVSGTLDAIQRGTRQRLTPGFKRVYLQEERTLAEYDVPFHPAIIGRRDHRDPSKNRLLVVDLEDAEESATVSRHHAAITEQGGSFFLESINENNPTFLNDQRLRRGVKHALPAGSRIRVGRVTLTFYSIS
jgi:hypothetical protein